MCNETYVRMILPYLQKKYEEKGNNDFFFKSKHLARHIPLHGSVIGKTMMLLKERGLITIWSDGACISKVWKTNFNGVKQ